MIVGITRADWNAQQTRKQAKLPLNVRGSYHRPNEFHKEFLLYGPGKASLSQEPKGYGRARSYLLFWMLAARTSLKAQIPARFSAAGSFKFDKSTEVLPAIVAEPSLIQPFPKS